MGFPPIKKTMEGLLEDFGVRLQLVERRLAKAGTGGSAFELPNRLGGPDGDITSIPAGTNLNSVTATGWYIQRLSAEATVALNYPINRAGHLEVSGGLMGTGADLFLQTYTEYAPLAPATLSRQWRRTNYNGTWTAWTLLAGPVNTLPAAVRYAPGNVNTIAATSWGTIVPSTTPQSITVSQPTWVLVTFGAWMQASAGETRAGISLSGATTLSPPNYQQDGVIGSGAWGQTLYMAVSDIAAGSGQRSSQRVYLLNPGTTTFTMEAYMATAGAHAVNYPVLEIIPLYVDSSAAPLPTTQTVVFHGTVPGTVSFANNSQVVWGQAAIPYTEIRDDANMHDPVTNPTRITIPYAGLWRITQRMQWATSTAGARAMVLVKNGTNVQGAAPQQSTTDNSSGNFGQSVVEFCVAGDYFETWTRQTSGGALTMTYGSLTFEYIP
jgi:hypothetical protein